MQVPYTVERWPTLTRHLHWFGAAYLLFMIADGYWMNNLIPRSSKLAQFHWHAVFGVYFLLLVLIRLAVRHGSVAPKPPAAQPQWEQKASKYVQATMYALMVVIPLLGWLTWSARAKRLPVDLFGVIRLPWIAEPDKALEHNSETVHIYLAYLLLALVVLHVAAAFRHHFDKGNDVLTRMLSR